jgi:hypothetical protein
MPNKRRRKSDDGNSDARSDDDGCRSEDEQHRPSARWNVPRDMIEEQPRGYVKTRGRFEVDLQAVSPDHAPAELNGLLLAEHSYS